MLTKEEREEEEQRLSALETMVRESRAKLGIVDGPTPVEQQLQQLNATVAAVAQHVQPAAPPPRYTFQTPGEVPFTDRYGRPHDDDAVRAEAIKSRDYLVERAAANAPPPRPYRFVGANDVQLEGVLTPQEERDLAEQRGAEQQRRRDAMGYR